MRGELLLAAGAVAVAAAGAVWWPVTELHNASGRNDAPPTTVPQAASSAQRLAALRTAAANVCADGCDALLPVAVESGPALRVAAATLAELPGDLDAWLLNPDAVLVEGDASVVARLHNIPDTPDDNDPTPADETDPQAPPVDAPAGE